MEHLRGQTIYTAWFKKFLKPEDDGRAVRQTPGRQSTTETEISDSISRVEKDVKKNK